MRVGRFTLQNYDREKFYAAFGDISADGEIVTEHPMFDDIEQGEEIPEYSVTLDEKQAVSCRRLGVVAVVVEPVKAPNKKAKKGKA